MIFKEYLFWNNLQIKDVAEELDITPPYLGVLLGGNQAWTRKVCRRVEAFTDGLILAKDMLGKTQKELDEIRYREILTQAKFRRGLIDDTTREG